MKLIVGLGNIGDKYTFTRHNVGFMLVDSIAVNNNLTFRENTRLKCFMTNLRNGVDDYLIIKPTTFMNLSGEAVRAVMDYYKIPVDDIIIVYDDLSLNLGKIFKAFVAIFCFALAFFTIRMKMETSFVLLGRIAPP